MSMEHRCAKCGCTVFTLEAPRANVGGYRIDTGIKLATCMECGSQDRPVEAEAAIEADRGEEQERMQMLLYQQLLNNWLAEFNKYANNLHNGRSKYVSSGERDDEYLRRYQQGRYH